jgi:hypothetical protein
MENEAGGNESKQGEPREAMRILVFHGGVNVGAAGTLTKRERTEKRKIKTEAGKNAGEPVEKI